MSFWRRGLVGTARVAAAVLVVLPLGALVGMTVLDRGPGGAVVPTAFPAALTLLDPFVWTCVGNSLVLATGVTLGSMAIGTMLALVTSRWWFWGRRPLMVLIGVPLAVPPLFAALGLERLLGRSGLIGLAPRDPGGWGGWLALAWLGLAGGAPWVGLRVRSALARVEPAWEDAGRLVGAGSWRVARSLFGPIVRPIAARGGAEVFTLVLVEPGAPWVLGLRRTLAFQTVEAALEPSAVPRAATLALLGLALALLGRWGLVRWGGAAWSLPAAVSGRPRRASAALGLVLAALCGGWAVVALAPALTLGTQALMGDEGRHVSALAFRQAIGSPEARQLVVRSLVVSAAVATVGLLLALATSGRPSPARWSRTAPPLAIAVGVALLPVLLAGVADSQGTSARPGASALRTVADGLDPFRSPGLLLGWALMATYLPLLSRAVALAGRRRSWVEPAEAASMLGASRWRAWWTAYGPSIGPTLAAAWLVTLAGAATDFAPGVLLSPTSDSRTLGPGVALLAVEPGGAARAAALACCGIALNLVAIAAALRGGVGLMGDEP